MMIITQTPVRLSLFGGGTDFPHYFAKNFGATISTSINKYTYITVNQLPNLFDHNIRVGYSITELCKNIDEIVHPPARECLRLLKIKKGVEINVISDLPARSGLGSSSSFTIGLLNALHTYLGKAVTKELLAKESILIERKILAERGGWQDQYICAYGGLMRFDYSEKGVSRKPMIIDQRRENELNENLMLFYTGIQRSSHEILNEQVQSISNGEHHDRLGVIYDAVEEAEKVLCSSTPLKTIGKLLHETWEIKKSFSKKISNPIIKQAYNTAMSAGAIGGKLLGAGGGGFLLLYVEKGNQKQVVESLRGFQLVNYSFESEGAKVIFYRK